MTRITGLADPHFGSPADFERATLAEGPEEPVEKDLGLALFVAGDVSARPGDEVGEAVLAGIAHAAAASVRVESREFTLSPHVELIAN